MLFNSIEFVVFFLITFTLYWLIGKNNVRAQNIFIIIASYIFYGWWDWRFLTLIFISSALDYALGLKIYYSRSKLSKKKLLALSVIVNIGFLGFFKYFNFFAQSFADAFTFLGYKVAPSSLDLILPVGISFYTFQTLSYSIDIYKSKLKPTKDIPSFFAFVSFFPQLVAGPIERAKNLLPQFHKKRHFSFNDATDGLRQMLWGFFKKIVIADNSAGIVNDIFQNYSSFSGSTLLLGAVLFAFQIYCDFSGYTDIAIGLSKLFGFKLKRNFSFPYFSRDIAEFWRRWHISLSTWFRDYIYIPMGGSRGGTLQKIRNIFVIFIVSGFWHGANWTFIVWGAINALYFFPIMLLNKNRVNTDIVAQNSFFPNWKEVFQMGFTFFFVVMAWIFFRAKNLTVAFEYLKEIFSSSLFVIPRDDLEMIVTKKQFFGTVILIFVLLLVEWIQRKKQHGLEINTGKVPRTVRWAIYYSVVFLIIYFGGNQKEFIYFQF